MPDGGQKFIGVGIFTVPEAARLTGVPATSIRRWAFGDPRGQAGAPLIRQLPKLHGQDALGFYNLVEVLFLRDLTQQGVSWPTIRRAAEQARAVLHDDHPLATRRIFHTDGRGLFLEVANETGDRMLLDLLAGNYAMFEMLERSFTKSLSFDGPSGHASLWRPANDLERIVVDPARSFGRPIDHETGVPTDVLASALVAERGDAAQVARWWDVPQAAVEQAAEFEVRFGLRRAA